IVLGYVFFGGSSKPTTNSNNIAKTSPTPRQPTTGTTEPKDTPDDSCSYCSEVNYNGSLPPVSEANRNIFAYYFAPSPTPKPPPYVPTPTPPPPPPLTARSLSPSNVFARTPADFALQV